MFKYTSKHVLGEIKNVDLANEIMDEIDKEEAAENDKEYEKVPPIKYKYELQTRKPPYPYEKVSSLSVLDEPIEKLTRMDFRNTTYGTDISDAKWRYVQLLIEEFNIKTFREFHNHYLISDVLH